MDEEKEIDVMEGNRIYCIKQLVNLFDYAEDEEDETFNKVLEVMNEFFNSVSHNIKTTLCEKSKKELWDNLIICQMYEKNACKEKTLDTAMKSIDKLFV